MSEEKPHTIDQAYGATLATELVRAIRGKRSQSVINRKLGFQYNKVAKWESGSPIRWLDFVELCCLCKSPLAKTLDYYLFYSEDPKSFALLVRHLKGGKSIKTAAADLNVSESTFKRWLRGQGDPTLHHILSMIHFRSGQLPLIVANLVSLDAMPVSGARLAAAMGRANVHYQLPAVGGLIAALELKDYWDKPDHDAELLAEKLATPVAKIKDLLDRCESAGAIRKQGDHYQAGLHTDTTADQKGLYNIQQYWLTQSLKRLNALQGNRGGEAFSYLVLPTTAETHQRMKFLLRKYYEEALSAFQHQGHRQAEQVSVACLSLFQARDL